MHRARVRARTHTLGCTHTHGMIISKCVDGVCEAMKFIINDRALCSQIYGLAAYQLRRLANHALQTRAPFIWQQSGQRAALRPALH